MRTLRSPARRRLSRSFLEDAPRQAWSLVLVASTLGGCNAYVNKFDVAPRHVCPGQEVAISWDVTGSPTLTVSPKIPGAPDGAVAASGRASIKPIANTRVSLRVTRRFGEPRGADVDIELPAPVEIAADLEDSPSCEASVLTLRTHTKGFTEGVTADVVSSGKRSIDVTRVDAAGHTITAHVAPGVTTTAFASLPMNGDWTLSSKLQPDEACSNPPHVLTLSVLTTCSGAAR
jgi:hypothetical protein